MTPLVHLARQPGQKEARWTHLVGGEPGVQTAVFEPTPVAASGGGLSQRVADLEARVGRVAFVKEGIAWFALIVPVLWLIYQRMWLDLIAFLAIFFSLPAIFGSGPAGQEIGGWVSLGLMVLFAFEANDLRGWALRRRGYKFAGTAFGRDQVEAETRFFSRWLPEQVKPAGAVPDPISLRAFG